MRIISGMHRSGTSLMGQLVFTAGLDMGDPATFYPADRWNPDGYYEQSDIIAINKALLHGSFGKLAYFWLPSTSRIMKRAQKRAAQIQTAGNKYTGKVVKGPRFSLTLPAWIQYGAPIDRLLFCIRDPIQVAQSIQKRNRTFIRHGLYLWYTHNKLLLEHLGDIPAWFVYYDNIMNDATRINELRSAFHFFDCHLSDTELQAFAAQCIKPDLYNNTQMAVTYPAHIQSLWADLRERHAAQFE